MNTVMGLGLLGALVAEAFYLSAILVFVSRLRKKPKFGYWLGVFELCLALPLVYLMVKATELSRPPLYFIQIGLMLAWLGLELVLDYILSVEFRKVRWMVIAYVTFFFAATGGMLGVASYAPHPWPTITIISFLVMSVLAFIQRRITGE